MEKAIRGMEHCIEKLDTVTNKAHGFNCTICPYFADCDSTGYLVGLPLMRDALALLKAQGARVMTAEDMWALKFNDVVILEQRIPSLLIPAIVRDNIKHDHRLEVLQVVTASMDGGANADYDYYGKTWRCWTSRPTEEQMEATPWG